MTVRFYFDEHVPRPIVSALRRLDVDVLTVFEDDHAGDADEVLLERAAETGRVVFTMDTDFLRLANDHAAAGNEFAGVVFARQTRVTIGQCVADLHVIAECAADADLSSRVTLLPL
ncbi:MAG: DUF5615 family PIN-like protein [Planctomycetota bacterium]